MVELEYLRAYATTLDCWVAGSGEEDRFSVQEEEGWQDSARSLPCSSGSDRTKNNNNTGTFQTEAREGANSRRQTRCMLQS